MAHRPNTYDLQDREDYQHLVELAQYEGDEPPYELILGVLELSKLTCVGEGDIYSMLDPRSAGE